MKFEYTSVFNFEGAFHGMRNPMNSWSSGDSRYDGNKFIIGNNDMKLAKTLIACGTEHRKFMRQIFVSVDITAPMYFWSEFDTYKVGTVANSTSKMHKLASTKITMDCFEMDDFCLNDKTGAKDLIYDTWKKTVDNLESLRLKYLETKEKIYWKELIRILPESWLQTRTVTMNYENILSICHQRKNHKLSEWSGTGNESSDNFIKWAKSLPYASDLLFYEPETRK